MSADSQGAPPPVDLSSCEAEPIHIPGSIQPHGALLSLRGPALIVTQASSSCQALLGVAAEALLERELASVLGGSLALAVGEALERTREQPGVPASFAWFAGGAEANQLEAHVHLAGERAVLELQRAPAEPPLMEDALAQVAQAFRNVGAQPDVPAKAQIAADWLRRLTGYDRVMIYRFHDDWHGEVIAEARRADLQPYLGLHYPASDIPAQARRLYLSSPTRVIVDVGYTPSRLVPGLDPLTEAPLDLSGSVLRSVSPVHLEYLRNMGVGATLVASLLCDGKLWGLVSCHHGAAHPVSSRTRTYVDWMALELATQITLVEESAGRRRAAALEQHRSTIVRAVRRGARLSALLRGPELVSFLAATGAEGVALVHGDTVATGGLTPEPARILAISAALSAAHAADPTDLFATDCLSEQLPGAEDVAATAAGVGMFPLDAAQPMKLLWFRGEQLRSVTWGGNPDKAMSQTPDGRLSPRQSFAAWTESVRFRGAPWQPEELASARELGAMLDLELRRMAEEEQRASEILLKDVIDSVTAHIAVIDAQGVILAVNRAWRRFASHNGGGEECLPGVDYLAVCDRAASLPGDDVADAARRGIRAVLAGTLRELNLEYPCDSPKEERWFSMRVFPLRGPRPGAVIAHEDVTPRKRFERQLAREQARLEELNASLAGRVAEAVAELRAKDQILITQSRQAAMGEMIGNIAHQWRQPLNALGLLLANLKDAQDHGALQADFVERLVTKGNALVQRMSVTINDFRDFFRPDKAPGAFSPRAQIEQTIALIEGSFERHGIAVALDAPEELELLGLPNEYAQVVLNLLANAKDAILSRSGVAGRVTITLRAEGDVGVLRIRDNGGGIAPVQLDRIFDPFFSTRESGSGIGLYMSKMIIEQSMHGRITARNVGEGESAGAELTVTCPLAPVAS